MTNEQFRDCFVGEKGYDALKKLMRAGNELTADLAKCWNERYEAEIAYAKALRKNSETLQKLAGKAKGSLAQALSTIATQTNVENEAHQALGGLLLNDIATPMKNLADTQMKARKPIEDALNSHLKIWKERRDNENKYRQRQFERSREIETLYVKIDEIPKSGKNSVKEVSKNTSLTTACIYPSGHTNVHMLRERIETSLQKSEQELEKTERKYHEATRDVEIARQSCDAEMCRCCDSMQNMEVDRLCETGKFIQVFNNAISSLSKTMNTVQNQLSSIRIDVQDDIINEGKQNPQVAETEILLYDIYAELDESTMSYERRIISLMGWIKILKDDIQIQRRSKDDPMVKIDSRRNDSSEEDEDGAMCRPRHRKQDAREGIENLQGFCKQNQNFSTGVNNNDIYTNQQKVRLLQCLYEASLYKMEKVYNKLKKLSEPQYEYSDRFAKTWTDKGIPTTFLRIPYQPLIQESSTTSSPMLHLVRSTPTLALKQQPMAPPAPMYAAASAQIPIGWGAINPTQNELAGSDNRSNGSSCPYPVIAPMLKSTDSNYSTSSNRVLVQHSYDAQRDDELTIRPGDIIFVIERRSDNWYKGEKNGVIGLFPGTFVQDI